MTFATVRNCPGHRHTQKTTQNEFRFYRFDRNYCLFTAWKIFGAFPKLKISTASEKVSTHKHNVKALKCSLFIWLWHLWMHLCINKDTPSTLLQRRFRVPIEVLWSLFFGARAGPGKEFVILCNNSEYKWISSFEMLSHAEWEIPLRALTHTHTHFN